MKDARNLNAIIYGAVEDKAIALRNTAKAGGSCSRQRDPGEAVDPRKTPWKRRLAPGSGNEFTALFLLHHSYCIIEGTIP